MNQMKLKHIAPSLLAAMAIVSGTGCSTTVVRENIISSIDTGLGASVAENKQTQLYELKAGYIRSQFYSIPTGKVVQNPSVTMVMIISADGKTTNCIPVTNSVALSNAANLTPQLVSGINAHTGLGDLLLGMTIMENFAVGSDAVNSKAAVAMYISQAATSTNAQAASAAVIAQSAAADKLISTDNLMTDKIISYVSDTNNTVKAFELTQLTPGTGLSQDWVNAFSGKSAAILAAALKGPYEGSIPALYKNIK